VPPVPAVLDRVEVGDMSAVLLETLLTSADGEVTGILDWANAAAGDPDLDRARTWAILTLDPAARARRGEPGWAALLDGWAESAALHDVPAAHRAWACAFMLRDLARRNTN
jgi:aminoglycoside phosphotransferase (APT) family kinase protein